MHARGAAKSVSTGIASMSRSPKSRGLYVAGSTVSFEIVIDDYAEIWVNGKLPTVLGTKRRSRCQRMERAKQNDPDPQRTAWPEI